MTASSLRPVPPELFGGRLTDCFLLELEVVAITDVAPRLREIRFASPDLVGFPWQPGQDVMFDVPNTEPSLRRRYSIRRTDPNAGTLDIQVVLHGDGPFARWTSNAAIGDRLAGIGPRGAITIDPDAEHHVIVGDETAIPVTLAMVEVIPPASRDAIVVSADADPWVDGVTWVHPDDLVAALASVPTSTATAAYVNGERQLVTRIAGVLADNGVPAAQLRRKAYWSRGEANQSHGEPRKA